MNYEYDAVGRVSKKTVRNGASTRAIAYAYLAGGQGAGSTTPLVSRITQPGLILEYEYDDVGNISKKKRTNTSVTPNVAKEITYKYDKLGQRIRVNDPFDTKAGEDGTTWQYVYDLGGNILSKTHYVYTTGIVGAAIGTDAYAYGDANWKDKLTAYSSEPITYDESGNPLTYDGWTYTWGKGRQLKRMEHRIPGGEDAEGNPLPDVVDRTLEFAYDAAGLRTQKKHTYTDAQGQTVVETTDYTLHGSC